MRKFAKLAALLLIPAMLAACNTVQGAGQDIKDGGHAVQGWMRGGHSSSGE